MEKGPEYELCVEANLACAHFARDLVLLGPLEELSIDKLHGLYRNGMPVEAVIAAHIDRLWSLNHDLHAVIQPNVRAMKIARELDAEFAQLGTMRGPLFGVPIVIKDNIYVDEPDWDCAAGSLASQALGGASPRTECPVVTKLRAAGAVLLGQSNCTEWRNVLSVPSDSGWSARGGQTFGAYHFRQDPGSSSSGSAVAVDMGFCVAALGTETSGSIIFAASQNNVVGLKPTVGLVSRKGIISIPVPAEQDTIGVLARSYTDAAYVLDTIAGRDPADFKTMTIPFEGSLSSSIHSFPPSIGALRIGVPRNALLMVHPQVLEAFQTKVLEPLEALGGIELVDCTLLGADFCHSLNHLELTDYTAGELNEALCNYCINTNPNPRNALDVTKQIEGEEHGERRTVDGGAVKATRGVRPNNPPWADMIHVWGRHTSWHAPGRGVGPRPAPGDTNLQPSGMGILRTRRNVRRFDHAKITTPDVENCLHAKSSTPFFAAEGGIQGALEGSSCAHGIEGINDHEPVSFLVFPTDAGCANYFAAAAGYPQVSIPLGYFGPATETKYNDTGRLVWRGPNIPYGVSVIGRHFDEARHLSHICKQIEVLLNTRSEVPQRRPAFLSG